MVTAIELVQIVLKLPIESISSDDENKIFDLEIETNREGLVCPQCGAQNIPVYDTNPRKWRHVNIGSYKTYIHYRQPRCTCPNCGIVSVPPPWAPKQFSHFTNAFELEVLKMAKSISMLQIAIHFDENESTIWGIIKRNVYEAMDSMDFHEFG
jgi:transposase